MPRTQFLRFEAGNQRTPAEDAVRIYRGWHEFERTRGGTDVVDFDLSTFKGQESFSSRREILAALARLHDRFTGNTQDEEFLRTRIQGSMCYLRALMGEQMPFPDYVMKTLGVEPVKFSDEEIVRARDAASRELARFGLAMRVEDRDRFNRELLIHDRDAIREGIVGNQEFWLDELRKQDIPIPDLVPLSVQFEEVDAYWSNWITGSAQRGFTLSINLHPRKTYALGKPLALCLHEICGHAVQMSIWRERIARGEINDACGLTTVHSPEAYTCEGLGQTVGDLLADSLRSEADFHLSHALQYHSLLVLHNAHLMLYERAPIEKILEYAADQLPLADSEFLQFELRDRGTNPLFRSYQLSYALAETSIRQLIEPFSPRQKRELFLQLYTRPMTPQQLVETAGEIGKGFDGNILAREAAHAPARANC